MNWQHLDAHTLKHIANAVNPFLTILLLGAIVWRRKSDAQFAAGRFIFGALLAIVFAFVLGKANSIFKVWTGFPGDPGHYEFPSGHTCFAVAVATSLCLLDRHWLLLVLPLLAAYGALIVLPPLHFHSWLDVVGAWILTPPLALLCHKLRLVNRQDAKISRDD